MSQTIFEGFTSHQHVIDDMPLEHKRDLLAIMQHHHARAVRLIGKLRHEVEGAVGPVDLELARMKGGVLSALLTSEAELRSLMDDLAKQIHESAEIAISQPA
jgi:hypothetical protein